MPPKTRYAKSPDGHVAYQVIGDGPGDIVFVPEHPSNLEIMWEEPSLARFLTRLSSIGRLICFDKRGCGLSDPVPLGALPTLEQWMDDVRMVLDAAGSERATVFGHGDGGPMSILFAATHPERTAALVLADTFARMVQAPDYECGVPPDAVPRLLRRMCDAWGTGDLVAGGAPSLADDASFREWRARYERLSLSPGELAAMFPVVELAVDVRAVLSTIRVPTLVLHRVGNRHIRLCHGRYLAEHIANAKLVELPGDEHFFHAGDSDAFLTAVQEFLTGEKAVSDDDRVLATILFTDIVDSTARAVSLGDRGWRDLLERFYALVRRELGRFRGREIDIAGDGFFAAFDGPARGVRCALAIRDSARQLGLETRAGLHTGECQAMGEKMSGIAVHIGARIASAAAPGEVLVSSTVNDLVAGSGLGFDARGPHALKGVEGEWRLFAAGYPRQRTTDHVDR